MEPNQLQNLVNPDSGLPQHMPSSMQGAPAPTSSGPSNPGDASNGHKKALLQKLITNLLSKPGRSMHEVINGVKEAIGAYKNYAREWDNLSMLGGSAASGASMGKPGASGIKDIMQQVQAKKPVQDGGGGPGMRPTALPFQAQGAPQMPQQAFGNPQPQQPQRPMGMPQQAQGTPTLPPQAFGNPQNQGGPIPPSPQPARPPEMQDLIAGQPQTSSFNRPAPISRLGIMGF